MKRILLIAVMSLSACAPAYAVPTQELVFTDADILQPTGGLPACIIEVPEGTFILPADCRTALPDVLARFRKLNPTTPYTVELNGVSLSGV